MEFIEIEPHSPQTPSPKVRRAKTSLRLKYEAEAQVLRAKLGGLEAIRMQLGLSQRKICQLLLVDPSAWNRWTQDGECAPPHVYRMLQWYLALNEKYPALDATFWLSTVSRETHESDREHSLRLKGILDSEIQLLNSRIDELKIDLAKSRSPEVSSVIKVEANLESQKTIENLKDRIRKTRTAFGITMILLLMSAFTLVWLRFFSARA